MMLTWRDKDESLHSIPLASAAEVLKKFYADWPGGFAEIESALRTAKNPKGITAREAYLLSMLRDECNHAARNNLRLVPSFGKQQGDIAIREDSIEAVIEGWKREHGLLDQTGV